MIWKWKCLEFDQPEKIEESKYSPESHTQMLATAVESCIEIVHENTAAWLKIDVVHTENIAWRTI